MKNLVRIKRTQALEMFLNYKKEVSASGVAFSSLTYICDESKSKTVKGVKVLQKMVTVNATIGSDYAKKVNKILDKEGKEIDFVAQPMNGKEYVSIGNPVCTDTATRTKHYLVFIVENHTKPETHLMLNGKVVDRKDVWNSEYITPAGLQPNPIAGRGEINEENNFFFRTLDFRNLLSFNMNGNCYLLED